jgi:hypothetical protein
MQIVLVKSNHITLSIFHFYLIYATSFSSNSLMLVPKHKKDKKYVVPIFLLNHNTCFTISIAELEGIIYVIVA